VFPSLQGFSFVMNSNIIMNEKKIRHPFSGVVSAFHWCSHCEKVHSSKAWNLNRWHCPTPKCSGDCLDAFPWLPDSWPCSENLTYPEIPVIGQVYPLYSELLIEDRTLKVVVREVARNILKRG